MWNFELLHETISTLLQEPFGETNAKMPQQECGRSIMNLSLAEAALVYIHHRSIPCRRLGVSVPRAHDMKRTGCYRKVVAQMISKSRRSNGQNVKTCMKTGAQGPLHGLFVNQPDAQSGSIRRHIDLPAGDVNLVAITSTTFVFGI